MALQSQFTRIEEAILRLIKPDTLASEQMRALIYSVLEFEMPTHVSSEYGFEDMMLTFKESDGATDRWRLIENATFADYLMPTNAANTCVVETLPEAMDLTGKQVALAYVSRQFGEGGGAVCRWDVNLDAVEGDLDAGTFLTKDMSPPVVLQWDTVTPLDIYPTRKVVFRFEIDGDGKLHWVRVRLSVVGSLARLSRDVEVIARFCAARWFDERLNRVMNGHGHPETIRSFERRVAYFKAEALGLLGLGSGQKPVVAGGAGGGVVSSGRPDNPWSSKLTGRV